MKTILTMGLCAFLVTMLGLTMVARAETCVTTCNTFGKFVTCKTVCDDGGEG